MTLRENTTGEARGLAGSVLGHIPVARDGASGASTLAVEEDQEDQCTHEGETTDHTDHDTSDGAAAEFVARCRGVGRGGILNACLTGGRNSDSLHLASRGSLLDNVSTGSGRVGCSGLGRHVSKFGPIQYLFGCLDNTVCVEFVDVPVDDEVLLVLSCATNEKNNFMEQQSTQAQA